MSQVQPDKTELRVLILAPPPWDVAAPQDLLGEAGIECCVCADLSQLCQQIQTGVGTILLSEETLTPPEAGPLVELLCEQPRWSDLPVLLLNHADTEPTQAGWALSVFDNVTLLDRPVHRAALLSAVRTALRARRRQYEMRDYLAERDLAEQAMRKSEARFRAFFEQAAVGIGETRPGARRFTRVNDRFCQLLGYTRDELLSVDISQITHPDDREDSIRWFNRLMRGEIGEYILDRRYIHKDGHIVFVVLHVTAVRDEHGHPLVAFGVVQDITARCLAEQALQHEKVFLRKVIDATPSFVFVKDRRGRFVLANEAIARSYGSAPDGMIGKTDADFNPNADQITHFRHDDLEVMDSRQSKLIPEELITDANSRQHCLRTIKVPLIGDDGSCDHVLGVATDITELKDAEQALRDLNATLEQRVAERTAEARQRAEQLSALAGELTLAEQRERQRLAEILHDHLQQMLVGARLNIAMLLARKDIPHLQQPLAQVVELLDDSLQTSRSLTAELSPPILRHGTLVEILRWLANWMRSKHGLKIHVTADETINTQAEEIRLLLFQASRELLFNIVKHAAVDEASLELSRDDNQLRITISDAGRGFDPAAHRPASHSESGFGLFSIRERMHLLGGCLDIESTPGRGTRATLMAPFQPQFPPA